MNKPRPLFELIITDDTQSGVDYVALVDVPAIQKNWVAFTAQEAQEKQREAYKYFFEDEKRVVAGPLMIPDLPIYRKSPDGNDFDVFFTAETIEHCVLKFMREGNLSKFNIMHNDRQKTKGVFIYQTFIIDKAAGITPPSYYEDLPDGTWFAMAKVEDNKVWADVKSGKFRGFSVEGMFAQIENYEWVSELLESLAQTQDTDFEYLEKLLNEI